MSFSAEIKKELSKLNNLANKKQVKYELIGYLLTNNTSVINKRQISYLTESEYNINRFSKLLANLKIDHQIGMDGNLFVITFKIGELIFLKQVEEMQGKQALSIDNIKIEDIKNEDDKKALIRGVFLGAGTITNPKRTYHLEIIFPRLENLKYIKKLLENFEINIKELENENKVTMYIKDGEEISKFLALIGASKGMLEFENIRVEKQMKSKVNRLVNCETANLTKTINAAVQQIEAIKKIKEEKKFNKLDSNLKEIALLRLKYPDISLVELGKKLKKPLGKSGVNYRLKKIMEIANLERKKDE